MIRHQNTPAYRTSLGAAYIGDSRELLAELPDNSVNLVMTSPPFALQRQKEYGNLDQHEYIDWFLEFAKLVHDKLTPDGSFVVDFGGAYMKGVPARSLYNFRVMIRMVDELGFFLAEDFYWFNPSKLPSPIEWVNKRKLRVKDSVNTVWWFSKTEWPKADVSKVLVPYSDRMKKLIEDPDKFYTPMVRPSGHDIGKGFAKDNGGAIPPNLLQIPNSESNGGYQAGCKAIGVKAHPARFPAKLPEFFIRMLTEPNDMVLDIFGGSNTTGQVAEAEGRRWMTFEASPEYVGASAFRFLDKGTSPETMQQIYDRITSGETISLERYRQQDLLAFK
ncbi:DNA-methyltransferase [Burkholderia multivorans]|uniref:DNA-methyltransferase n=1 Tax=Burkholderia multivorans TaxID=87883 RepID=UPI0009BE5D76|nr:site-specific DNA-methyltransferase [Burkholderia multivorans]